MQEQYDQGRFGPPPLEAVVMTSTWEPGVGYSLTVQVKPEGGDWRPRARFKALTRHDFIEAVATEAHRQG